MSGLRAAGTGTDPERRDIPVVLLSSSSSADGDVE